jgi:hypothetical protein
VNYSKDLEIFIEDLSSTNGTYLGSSPLEIHKVVIVYIHTYKCVGTLRMYIYVCIFTCCMDIWIYMYVYFNKYEYIFLYVCIGHWKGASGGGGLYEIRTFLSVLQSASIRYTFLYIDMWIDTLMCIHVYIYVYKCMFLSMYVWFYVYLNWKKIHICIYVHVQAYTLH